MKSNKKRIILAVVSCVLLAVLGIGVTLAYLSDYDSADNIFAVGNIDIMLNEPNYPKDQASRVMVPYQVIKKDPQIVNVGDNDAFVFIKLTVPLEESTMITEDRERETEETTGQIVSKYQEIFTFGTNSDSNISTQGNITYNDKWIYLSKADDEQNNTCTYIFGYSEVLEPTKTTATLFDTVELKSILEQEDTSNLPEKIIVEGYGIQTENIMDQLINTSVLDKDNLTKIYSIIENQKR